MADASAEALVVGAGPAGLMAAEVMAAAGLRVAVAEAMPSPARKFLMAGKSGLNLTKDEDPAAFARHFTDRDGALPPALATALARFGPAETMAWARGLGQPVFTGSTGRVFPEAMKGSPLLRAWLGRLEALGVTLHRRWRWEGWADAEDAPMRPGGDRAGGGSAVLTPGGRVLLRPAVTVLAMGGASWRRLGSDGAWAAHLPGVTAPFRPANMGFAVEWSPHMAPHFGTPVKGCALMAGGRRERGEFVVSARGIEGGGIYALSRDLREGAALRLDLAPDLDAAEVARRLARPRGKASLANHLRRTLRLGPVQIALLNEFGRPFPQDLARLVKDLPLRLAGPRPMDEAISTAGGVRFDALDEGLMLRARPGVFVAGEMLDWEAPTGGYLLTGCLATGRLAGQSAVLRARAPDVPG